MFWTILFLFLSALTPEQPVATKFIPTSDPDQVGKRFNPTRPGGKPVCRCITQ